MKWKNIHCIRFFAALCVLLTIPVGAREGMGWYCVRNSANQQPRFGEDLCWVEQYDGYYIDHRHGDAEREKVVYLTFDAGYENGNVAKTLDVMREHNVTGAFFILGNVIEREPALVRRMVDEGHLVCNHTYYHPDMTTKTTCAEFADELTALEEAYTNLIGQPMPKYYRPPEGRFNEENLAWAQSLGYKTIFWSFAYADWDNQRQPTPEQAKEKILSNLHNGAVILLHPTSATNAAVLGDIITQLKADGWRFGSLDELTAAEAK
ncbi:MAG: polysaccharide deacetylase family protein [Clostridia bacterium]|nr:polysaccharide deacetylase family protein [Clostridia bacterium]